MGLQMARVVSLINARPKYDITLARLMCQTSTGENAYTILGLVCAYTNVVVCVTSPGGSPSTELVVEGLKRTSPGACVRVLCASPWVLCAVVCLEKCGRVRVPEVRRAKVTSVCRGGASCRVCGVLGVSCALLWVMVRRVLSVCCSVSK